MIGVAVRRRQGLDGGGTRSEHEGVVNDGNDSVCVAHDPHRNFIEQCL